jgi:hypothetical protein
MGALLGAEQPEIACSGSDQIQQSDDSPSSKEKDSVHFRIYSCRKMGTVAEKKGSLSLAEVLCNQYGFRRNLQKAESLCCWMIALLAASTEAPLALLVLILQSAAFSRAFAYAVDFSNAWIKFDGAIPMWLALWSYTYQRPSI